MNLEPLRILLADDHAAVRRSIRTLLESDGNVICCDTANGDDAVREAAEKKPDVAFVDVSMPGVNGFEAARGIARVSRLTRVFLLTLHQSDELETEARKAGAEAVILKSNADKIAEVIARIRKSMIHLAGSFVRHFRHIGGFFASDAERYRVLRPFVTEGLERGERALHIIDSATEHVHVGQIGSAAEPPQFELAPWEEMYLAGGLFDQHAMLRRIGAALRSAPEYPRTRLVAHMEWACLQPDGVDNLVDYESRLNDVLEDSGDIVLCTYDISKFDARTIVDVIRAHPAVIIGGALRDNPFYTPPD